MRLNTRGKSGGHRSSQKEQFFDVRVKLLNTSEMFTLKKIHNDMKISEMKGHAEFVTGIPADIQRIRYLDEGDLLDSSTVRSNDIVGGAQLHMTVWSEWSQLIEAIVANDIDYVFKLGVTQDTDFRSPHLDYLLPSKRKAWLFNRAKVALYIAAHRGHQRLCERLIAAGAAVNGETKLGRTALHVAACQGHGDMLNMLLAQGGNIDAEDSNGQNALTVANAFGHKACERHLFMFRWQQRAKQNKTVDYVPMFAHQYHDSSHPVWKKGRQAQMYVMQILPPGEYEGTSLSAPRRPGWIVGDKDNLERIRKARLREVDVSDDDTEYTDGEDDTSTKFPDISDRSGRLSAGLPTGLKIITEEKIHDRTCSIGSAARQVKTNQYVRKKKKKPSAFDTWLSKKEFEENIKFTAKREERKKKREEEDNKKKDEALQDAMKETSYEAWLAEQDAANKKSKREAKLQTATGGKTTGDVIKALLLRQQAEGGYHGLPTDIWTADRTDPKLYNQIKMHGNLLLEHYHE